MAKKMKMYPVKAQAVYIPEEEILPIEGGDYISVTEVNGKQVIDVDEGLITAFEGATEQLATTMEDLQQAQADIEDIQGDVSENTQGLARALKLPTTAPSVRQVVTVGTNNAQSNVPEANLVVGRADSITRQSSAPTSANTTAGLKFVVLTAEPATKYDGYIYIITEV